MISNFVLGFVLSVFVLLCDFYVTYFLIVFIMNRVVYCNLMISFNFRSDKDLVLKVFDFNGVAVLQYLS